VKVAGQGARVERAWGCAGGAACPANREDMARGELELAACEEYVRGHDHLAAGAYTSSRFSST